MLARLLSRDALFSGTLMRAALSLGIRVGGVLLMLAAQILLARAMPVSEYGVFIYAINIIPLATLLLQLGFPSATIKFMHHYKGEPALLKGFVRISFLLPAVLIAAVCALLWLVHAQLPMPEIMHRTVRDGVWIVLFFAMTQMAQQHLRALHKVSYSQVFEQIGLPLLLIGFAGLVLLRGQPSDFSQAIGFYGVCYIVLTLITTLLLARVLASHSDLRMPARYETRYWLKTAMPMGVGVMAITLLSRIDIFMLGMFLPAEAIAHYGVASRIAGFLMFALAALGAVLDPIISQMYHEGRIADISRLIGKVVRLVLLGGAAMFAGLLLLGEFILGLFGAAYVDATSLMLILAAGQMVNLSAGPSVSILNISGHQKIYMQLLLVCVVLTAGALWLVIPAYGVLGAAVVTSVMLAVMNAALGVLIYRKTGIRIL